tara:strand:- start:3101 stop:3274 length:174 start_codon:yes stop_codon:yes gene_type:complete
MIMDTKIKQRQRLCYDLQLVCERDSTILEQLIDEYVFLLSDKEVEEYEVLCGSILED